MKHTNPRARTGFSVVELLLAVAIAGLLALVVSPRVNAYRTTSAVRSARLEAAAVVEAARAAAVQRGRPARVVANTSNHTLVASVDTGPPGGAATGRYTVLALQRFDSAYRVTLSLGSPGDTMVLYDARGLANPRLGRTLRWIVTRGTEKDSVCVTSIGLLLPRGCTP